MPRTWACSKTEISADMEIKLGPAKLSVDLIIFLLKGYVHPTLVVTLRHFLPTTSINHKD